MNFKGISIKKIKKKKVISILVLILVVVFAFQGIRSLKKNKGIEAKEEIRNVKTQKIKLGSISAEVEFPGNLKAKTQVAVFPKTGGRVASVNVNVGDKVTAGQLLYTLDTAELEANLQAQQAGLQAASANLEKTSDSGLAQQVSQAEQSLQKAQVRFNDVKDNYDKMQKLYAAGAIAKKELDDAKTQYDNASIDLNADQTNLNLLLDKIGPQNTKAAAAQVAQSQAGVNSVQIQINNAKITSPISGIVAAKDVEVGQMAGGQSGSVTVIDSTSVTAEITVPDKMLGRLQVGQSIPVVVSALENKEMPGVIETISPEANSKDNSYIVKIKVDNANGEIKSGMFAKVSLQAESKDNVLIVPNQAIKIENGVNYIYTVENGKIKKVSVNTGISNNKFTEVSGNIKENNDIITEGQSILADGEKVNIVK
ncbi:efflux RND transporter periplasmic adaptor subunit [Clostridium aciditolerans]|uniref:Efflux RND transporter periplasmic adaptor subunit n=1 Tax=Clostridium aciditolerans TaxID=339861 RepID=A0A934I2Y8_9CLOT|nr:efflux RND transporter periplasmic adaptor subunit [Clostridium aciditolerans]MBI6875333.1 efflux RND transporter periplasmic adaptor subunit [Clostridium aciditolerans]